MALFLTADEIKELTEIRGGKPGKTMKQRQAECLRAMRIPFFLNDAGTPKVARATIEGIEKKEAAVPSWEPALAHG